MSEHYATSWTTDVGPLCAECHSTFPCKPYLTEQVASLTARLTELEGADIALEDAIAEMRRMRDERDEERRKFDKQFAKAWDAIDRALAAEQRVKELEDVVDAVRQWGEYTPRRVARALAALTGTEPGEGTDVPPPSR